MTICSGGVAALGSKVGPERDNPLSEEKITIRHVGFDLLTCWINAQLPSLLLGSLHTQEVRHTSLTGWSNSHFPKIKMKHTGCLYEQLFRSLLWRIFTSLLDSKCTRISSSILVILSAVRMNSSLNFTRIVTLNIFQIV